MTNPADPPTTDAHLGYTEVDGQPDTVTVLAGMDATAAWPAVRQLRAWEHDRLEPRAGDRVLDVGCGLGDVVTALAAEVAPRGRAVGVDASAAMLDVAGARAREAGVEVEFRTADATQLAEPGGSFDICRSERMLQWLADPSRGIAEMVRVLRPGGRLSVIDTDWRTLTIDLPDAEAVAAVGAAIWNLRGAPASVGSQLLNLCRATGQLVDLAATAATHVWTHWDPDTEAGPAGLFPMRPSVEQIIETGTLHRTLGERFVDQLEQAARADRLFMSITMFAVFGRKRTAP